ncbi:hypothetical protein [Mucilaginibacter xinganensis]|uniref:Uncharacterized protein n=1 Tax=Mucilaginibacter xinganensis TaxID=1234841 RepID=A0A223NXG1_9SPHI|nr:hypothetical protein [Mucilaginibacter xinganensis]ASU34384.1 hypothetical protein MuYL_2497 [Mucilaginibacter xinganensis]
MKTAEEIYRQVHAKYGASGGNADKYDLEAMEVYAEIRIKELENLLAIHEKRNEIIKFIFDIDWMGTKEFCEAYSIPAPIAFQDVKACAQQFIFVDCMRWKKAIEKAKEIARANPLPTI